MGQRRAIDAVVASLGRASRLSHLSRPAVAATASSARSILGRPATPRRRSLHAHSCTGDGRRPPRASAACNGLPHPSTALRADRARSYSHQADTQELRGGPAREGQSIAIIGGGLTGLTTAYYMARSLGQHQRLTLFESGDRLGGWIKTDRVPVDVGAAKGVVSFERGPRTLSSLGQSTWRFDDLVLYDLVLDLGLKLHTPPNMPRHIYYPDHLVSLPPAAPLARLLQEPLVLESIFPVLVFLMRRLLPRQSVPAEDLSVAEWVRAITGSYALADNAVSAMLHGIYGGDVDRLSARCVLEPIFWAYYLPRLQAGFKAMPVREKLLMDEMARDPEVRRLAMKPKGTLLHFGDKGMESLPLALADALRGQPNVDVRLNEPILEIAPQQDQRLEVTSINGNERRTEVFDKVIATIPSSALARIAPLPALHDLEAVSIMTVNLWYPQQDIKPPGFGYLIPRSVPPEQNPEHALGVFFDSDVGLSPPSEPAGTKLFVLMGGHYYSSSSSSSSSSSPSSTSSSMPPPPPTPDQAVQQAKAVLERHLGIPRDAPCFAMARLAKDCIPQHLVGHHDTLAQLAGQLHDTYNGRLAVAGGSYSRIGAMGALRSGYDAARNALDELADEDFALTGLEWLDEVGDIAMVPVSDIPVRRFRRQAQQGRR